MIFGCEKIQRFWDRQLSRRQRPNRLENLLSRFFFADHSKLNQLAIGNWQLLIITINGCSHVPVGRAHGAQRRGYISSTANERRSLLAIDNSSRYSGWSCL